MQVIIDGFVTAGLIAVAVFFPKLRKPIVWLLAVCLVLVIALRLLH